jgi:hypothetical protein
LPNVYVVNKSTHDFTNAKTYGKLIFLSRGKMSRYEPNKMYRQFNHIMINSSPEDYILFSGLSMMNCMAVAAFLLKHKRLNLLLFKDGRYIERNLKFNEE